MKFILSPRVIIAFLFLAISSFAMADNEPMTDYSFHCVSSDAATRSIIEVSGGVDPSGTFAMYVRASNSWRALNGIAYNAKRNTVRHITQYKGADMGTMFVLTIDWSKNLSIHKYESQFSVNGLMTVASIKLQCSVSE